MKPPQRKHFLLRLGLVRPGFVLLLAYAFVILFGALLLLLPFSHHGAVGVVDAVFTAASALTVTGLNTVNLATTWTWFGKLVILIWIQLGGIGIMSLTTMSFLGGARASLSLETLYFQELTGSQKMANARTLVRQIVILTLTLEAIGAALLFIDLVRYYPVPQSLGYAVFHAVSAFCNAGFTLTPDS